MGDFRDGLRAGRIRRSRGEEEIVAIGGKMAVNADTSKDPFFTILVSIPLKPGCAKEFLALLDDLFAAMHSEPTFVNATALQSTNDPDTIVLCETWLDVDNFSTLQMNRPYRAASAAPLPHIVPPPPLTTSSLLPLTA